MTYSVFVLDRGRPIAKHPHLDRDVSLELIRAYRALGWPEQKIRVEEDEPEVRADKAA